MSVIRLRIEPMGRLTALRIWLACRLVPRGWAVHPVQTTLFDPALTHERIERLREEFRQHWAEAMKR